MNNKLECSQCKFPNPEGAQFCEKCGQQLGSEPGQTGYQKRGLVNWMAEKANRVLDVTDDFIDALSPHRSAPQPEPDLKTRQPGQGSSIKKEGISAGSTSRTPQLNKPKQPGSTISYFQILDSIPLNRSNFYKVYGIRCENCDFENHNNQNLHCTNCQMPLRRFVIRETAVAQAIRSDYCKRIVDLSESVVRVLKHNKIFHFQGSQFILLDGFPEPWYSLGLDGVLPIGDFNKIKDWMAQIGKGIDGLHKSGYGYYDEFSPEVFIGEPDYLYEFKRKVSRSQNAIESYKTTWRKLAKYASLQIKSSA